MEVTLKAKTPSIMPSQSICFNPCFNGSDSKRVSWKDENGGHGSFNPCFNGSDSKREFMKK